MVLYWRDGLEVIASLFANPVFANSMEYTPYRLRERLTGARAFGEFMSGDFAWDYAVRNVKKLDASSTYTEYIRTRLVMVTPFLVSLELQIKPHSRSVPAVRRCIQCSFR